MKRFTCILLALSLLLLAACSKQAIELAEGQSVLSEDTVSVHPDLPDVIFRAVRPEDGNVYGEELYVVNARTGGVINHFILADYNEGFSVMGGEDGQLNYELMDLNFDGYQDFRLFSLGSMHFGRVFVWDIEAGAFDFDAALSELSISGVEDGLIRTFDRGSAENHREGGYKYIDGELVLAEETISHVVQLKQGVTQAQFSEVFPQLDWEMRSILLYRAVKVLEDGELTLVEARFELRQSDEREIEWDLAAQHEADSAAGKKLAELVDWDQTLNEQ